MVVVEFAYEEMKRLIDLPREKMVASLNELGAPAEYEPEVGRIIAELTPNRPDWYSMEGLARALKTYHGKESPEYQVKRSEYTVIVNPSVAKVRPYTACAVVKGLRLDDQRIKDMVLLQEKLLATLGRRVKKFGLGLYPLNAIRFPVHYTTMKPGDIRYVPLGHEEEMGAGEILEKHKKGQQYGHILQGHERYPVFTDGDGKIMALIPIVNSAETGKIDLDTKDLFIEVSGTDIHACKAALNILVCTFADMGGTIYGVTMDYSGRKSVSPELEPRHIALDLKAVNRTLGVELKEKEAAGYLARMGYGYEKGKVLVPPYRADVMGLVDIIEDIAIAYGYNNFKPTLPDFFHAGEAVRTHDELDRIMRGMGFMETKTFILTNKERLGLVGSADGVVEVENPGTVDYTVVRPNLLADMLDTFRINKMKGLPQRFYEIGIVHEGKACSKRLVFGVMDKNLDFSAVRGFLQTLAFEKGFDFTLSKEKMKAFDANLSCTVVSKGRKIGVFGKADKAVLEKLGLPFDVYLCELTV
ncbi:MAG: phenylalanine--tRNA ligase subunit beta [Candidatus Micrarchaeota archaeon]